MNIFYQYFLSVYTHYSHKKEILPFISKAIPKKEHGPKNASIRSSNIQALVCSMSPKVDNND